MPNTPAGDLLYSILFLYKEDATLFEEYSTMYARILIMYARRFWLELYTHSDTSWIFPPTNFTKFLKFRFLFLT